MVMTNLDSGHSDPAKIAQGVAAFYAPALKKPEAHTAKSVNGLAFAPPASIRPRSDPPHP
jgi:hypothetical protein